MNLVSDEGQVSKKKIFYIEKVNKQQTNQSLLSYISMTVLL